LAPSPADQFARRLMSESNERRARSESGGISRLEYAWTNSKPIYSGAGGGGEADESRGARQRKRW
jgi:hypothetical protein